MARPLACQGYCADFYVAFFALGLVNGKTGPGDFRIGEDHGGNRVRLERGRLAGEHFDGDLAFVRRLVREHRFASHVADRQDVRVSGLPAARRLR